MTAKDAHGSKLFTSGDFLTANQVAGFSSRLASKKAVAEDPDATESTTEEAEEDIGAATVEADFQEMMNSFVDDLLPKHPLTYDSHNLCELVVGGNWLGSHAMLGSQSAFVKHLLEIGRLCVLHLYC